jgi:creatinine amidohydrolase
MKKNKSNAIVVIKRGSIKKAKILVPLLILWISIHNGSVQAQISDAVFNNTMVRMTWQEVKMAATNKAIVLVPVSVVEEHGPHMDLSPDISITSHICSKMKASLEKENIQTVIAPPYYWGINISTGDFPGSFNLKESTMKLVLSEIIANMNKWGFKKFYLINIHGDPNQISAITHIASILDTIGSQEVYDITRLPDSSNPPVIPSRNPGAYEPDYHAGANETKVVWAIEPSIVRTDIAGTLKPQSYFSPLGYVGDPANYLKDNGDIIFDALAEYWAQRIKFQLSSTSMIRQQNSVQPKTYSLFQNYSNPFNPTTTVKFQIPAAGHVVLKVINMLGSEVAVLVNKEMNAGTYEVNFNAGSLSSGTYFYQLKAGKYSETKKMSVLK